MDALARFGLTAAARAALALAVALLVFVALAAGGAGQARAAMTVTVDAPTEGTVFTDAANIPEIAYTITGDYAYELCAFDDDPPADCFAMSIASPFKLTNGAHTATVMAVDGNGGAVTATANFTVTDTTAPSLSIDTPAEGATVSDLLAFDLTTDDAGAEILARIDDGPSEPVEAFGTSVSWRPMTLANGVHSVVFTSTDPAGNQAAQTLNFTLADSTPPGLANLSPAPGSTVRGDRVHVTFYSTDVNVRSAVSLDGHAGLDLTPGSSIDIPNVPAGAHTLTVTATDIAGNTTIDTSNFTVSDTGTGPLTIVSPADGAAYTARPRLQIEDPALGIIVHVRSRLANGNWYDGVDQGPIARLVNGANALDVRTTTDAGDLLTGSSSFTVNDTAPPSLTVLYPASGEVLAQLTGFAPVLDIVNRFADDTDDPGVRVRCRLDGHPFGSCNTLVDEDENLAGGGHTLKVEAIDWAGNAVVQSVSFSVADNTAPAVQILSPVDGATVTTGRPAVTFWSDDGNARFSCRVDGGATNERCEPGYAWIPGAELDVTLVPGPHTFSVTATDQAGRIATSSVSVTVADSTAPVVTIVSPTAAATLNNRVIVRWVANEHIARARCRIDGGAQIDDLAQCATVDPGSQRAGIFAPRALVNGARTLTIDAYDAAGNLGTASVAVTVADSTPPDVRISGFEYPAGISHAEAPTGVNFSSDDPAAGFECRLDSAAYVACGSGNFGVWSFLPPADGSHTVDVRATDAVGLSAVASVVFAVADTTPPAVSVLQLGEELGDGSLVPISFTAEVVAGGAVTVSCAIDGGAPVNCAGGLLPVSFGGGGVHTLQVTADDAAANQTVHTLSLTVDPDTVPALPGPGPAPPSSPAPPSTPPATPPPPAAPPAPRATFAAIKPKIARGKVTLALKVFVLLPAGVDAPAACKGSARLTVVVGRKTVGKANAALRLAKGVCGVATTLKLKTKPVAGKKANFTMKFAGNATIGGFTASKTVKIKAAKKR